MYYNYYCGFQKLMKGKVFGLSLPNKKTAMAPHLHNGIPKVKILCVLLTIISLKGDGEVKNEQAKHLWS